MALPKLWRPGAFQGSRTRDSYFEGWYCKAVTADLSQAWSFILGMSTGRSGEGSSSFIQVIEGRTARTWWFEHPLADFEADSRAFRVRVGRSELSSEGLVLDEGQGEDRFAGRLSFGPLSNFPPKLLSPGIMGPYSFVPFMECRHGLISLDHGLQGSFAQGGKTVDLDGGRGYMEKDWGSSMPSSWIWMQSNNFPRAGDSFMLSLATVPWLGSSFPGFLFAARLGGRLFREASYTGAFLEGLEVSDESLALRVRGRRDSFELRARRSRGGILRAPVHGTLSRRIAESVDASIGLTWTHRGRQVFEGLAPKAGLELVGDPQALLAFPADPGPS